MSSDYFGFTEKPFELTPDPQFLFPTAGFKGAREALLKGIEEKRGWILLTGEAGTGKTLLLHEIICSLPAAVKSAFLFHATFSYKELLEEILRELGIPPTEEGQDPEKRLLDRLKEWKAEGQIAVVCIDEAHKLQEGVLNRLFAFMEREEGIPEVLVWIFSGQPEGLELFRGLLEKFRSHRRPLLLHLGPLSPEESRAYIEHRLQIAGKRTSDLFSDAAVDLIIIQARGIPRWINTLCDNALFLARKQGLKHVDIAIVQEAVHSLEGPGYGLVIPKANGPLRKRRISPRPKSFGKGAWAVFFAVLVFGVFWILPELHLPSRPSFKAPQKIEPKKPASAVLPLPSAPYSSAGDRPTGIQTSPGGQRVRVQKGQNLSGLIFRFYGKYNLTLADRVLMHNPTITDINLILVDQTVLFPPGDDKALLFIDRAGAYWIHLGTFATLREAEAQREKVKDLVIRPSIHLKKVTPRMIGYRLLSGPYGTREKALMAVQTLQAEKRRPY